MCVVCPCIGAAPKASIDSCKFLVHADSIASLLELTIDAISTRKTPCEVLRARSDPWIDVLTWIRKCTVPVILINVSTLFSEEDFMARAYTNSGTCRFLGNPSRGALFFYLMFEGRKKEQMMWAIGGGQRGYVVRCREKDSIHDDCGP